jgi:hypothetical protein
MTRTRTPGIRLDRNGGLIIDKEHRRIPIYFRLGRTNQEEAEQRLSAEIHRVDALLQGNANRRPAFATADQHAARDPADPLPNHLGRTGPALCEATGPPREDGAFRRQYGTAREQRLRT